MSKNWKNFERKIAKIFNTQRTALSGSNSKITSSDTLHPELYIEIKSNLRYPKEAKKYDFVFFIDEKYYLLISIKKLTSIDISSKYTVICYRKHSLLNLIREIEIDANKENKIPILVFKENNKHDIYLLFRFTDINRVKEVIC